MNEMNARVAARYFGSLQVLPGQFPRPIERLPGRHYFGNYSPLMRDGRRDGLRVEQKCLSPTCSSAIAPRSEDSVAWHNTAGEVRRVMECCAFRRDNHTR